MRVALDTNVLIAALISRGVCADLLEHCVLRHTLLTSNTILDEVRRHLIDKFAYTATDVDEAVALLKSQMEVVTPISFDQPVCRDPDDDRILGTAVAGKAECIITGDKDLLVLQQYAGVEIIAPNSFVGFETGGKDD